MIHDRILLSLRRSDCAAERTCEQLDMNKDADGIDSFLEDTSEGSKSNPSKVDDDTSDDDDWDGAFIIINIVTVLWNHYCPKIRNNTT